ncbi:MAG: glycosyltransferase [Alphaproteobacteria bacterium]|nr:glycosyltransferase [Alphaproteobacteria bacterium]
MTLIVIDPGLHMVFGHHYELDTAILEAAAAFGVEGHIFGHRTDNPHLNNHPQVTPFFDVLTHPSTKDPMLVDLDRFQIQNERLYDDLKRLSDVIDIEQSTLFYATADHNTLTGLGRWVAEWKERPRRLFVLLPGHFVFAIQGGGGTLDQLFYRYGFSRFPAGEDSRVRFLALSARQAREFSMIGGRNVEHAPYPVGELGGLNPSPRAPSSGRRRVLVCGSSRDSKGFALLPDVIRRVSARRSDVEFVVQFSPTEGATLDAIAASGATIIDGYLDRSSYHATIRSADVMLLPYLGSGYRAGTSAVFAEARWFGIPVVSAVETSMGDEIAADPRIGLAVRPEPAVVADAVEAMLNAYPARRLAAEEAADGYRQNNGTTRFAAMMLGRS